MRKAKILQNLAPPMKDYHTTYLKQTS